MTYTPTSKPARTEQITEAAFLAMIGVPSEMLSATDLRWTRG